MGSVRATWKLPKDKVRGTTDQLFTASRDLQRPPETAFPVCEVFGRSVEREDGGGGGDWGERTTKTPPQGRVTDCPFLPFGGDCGNQSAW